jgi:hypothetical protein
MFLVSAAFLAVGTPVSLALPDPAADTATGTTGTAADTMGVGAAAGTTGAQQSTTCPTPALKGLPKTPKFTNATINFKLTNMTVGAAFMLKAGDTEVYGSTAAARTIKDKFQLPHQGATDRKIMITAIIDANCENAPWKLQKAIKYDAVTTPAAATPVATPPAGAPAAGTPSPGLPIPTPARIKPPKLPKPLNQRLPHTGPPPSRFAWMTPIDGGAQLEEKLAGPKLSPLERKSEKANSGNALLGLGIVGGLLGIATVGGFLAFRHRDEVQFERAMTEQLKHLEEGDPGLEAAEDPHAAPFAPAEEAPFADTSELPATEPVPATAHANGSSNGGPAEVDPEVARHRAEVEGELQRILNEAGVQAGLEGILMDARHEAERHGIALDPELILHALCEEINGSARLSDPKRAELRAMFAEIVAEEAQHVPAASETVPAQ